MKRDAFTKVRQALEAVERDRVDSFDSGFTQLPKGTVNMVIDLLRSALHSEARKQRPGSTASTFDAPPVAAASSRAVKFTSDKRRTCQCGHRYSAHSTDGQHCLAQVDYPGTTSSQICSCHGWKRAVDPPLSEVFQCRCGAAVDALTGIGNDGQRHPREKYLASHPSLHSARAKAEQEAKPKRHRHRWVDRFDERWECDLCGAIQAGRNRSIEGSEVTE